jgi:D-alanyl-D-alanine carboxypeptidase (penicillin-binding protein 5/6)
MTAKVVLAQSNLNLDKKVTIQKAYSDYIVANNASQAHLIVGDKVTVRQLLYGLMLPSGCDAAYALADKFGTGTTRAARVKSFIAKMNSTARSLGMTNTKFDSFDGIGNGANYSTPRDLTKLASNVMKNSTFKAVVKTKKYTAKTITKTGSTRTMAAWTNTNTLLSSYSGTIGVKTGSGPEAKYCLVFAATRNGKTVIGTVLASTSIAQRETDAKKLLNYGFLGYDSVRLYAKGQSISSLEVWKGEARELKAGFDRELFVSVPKGQAEKIKATLNTQKPLLAPIAQGQKIGTMKVTLDGRDIAEVPVVSLEKVEAAGIFGRALDTMRLWFAKK